MSNNLFSKHNYTLPTPNGYTSNNYTLPIGNPYHMSSPISYPSIFSRRYSNFSNTLGTLYYSTPQPQYYLGQMNSPAQINYPVQFNTPENSAGNLEIILIGILILVSLDLVIVRPIKQQTLEKQILENEK